MNTDFNTKTFKNLNERDSLQDLFDNSFIKMDTISLRNHYQKLRKLEFDSPLDFALENVDISSLVENLTLACDIICTENGTNFIYCGNSTSITKANQKFITKAFLNLLSNAFLYGCGNLITVKTIEKSNFISIEVQNAGWLGNDFAFGDGLKYVNKICQKLKGHFFISTDLLSVKSVMLIPKSRGFKDVVRNSDFCELLGDRLSPVYVEFFGIK